MSQHKSSNVALQLLSRHGMNRDQMLPGFDKHAFVLHDNLTKCY